MKSTSTRCALLDELRGLDLISMMLYHGMWDLVYLFGVSAPWYGSWQGELWQQSICWVFILLSGFCLPLGRHPVKRGAVVFGFPGRRQAAPDPDQLQPLLPQGEGCPRH